MKTNNKYTFEVREIDGIMYDDCWIWNTSYLIGYFTTSAKNVKRAFTDYLRKQHNISFKLNRTIIEDEQDIITIIDRKTKEPLFAAIYREQ